MAKRKNKSGMWGIVSMILLFLAKFKFLFIFLKAIKLSSLLSLFLSLGVYAMFYGFKFAVALMYSLVLHETGHMIAAKQRGIRTSPVFFIPFIGAAVGIKDELKHSKDESYVAYAGPFLGMLATLVAILLYLLTHSSLYALMVYLGSILNLFNLLPVSPLDGGRIVSAISPRIWLIGIILLAGLMFIMPNPIIILILIFGIINSISQLRQPVDHRYYQYDIRRLKKRADLLQRFNQIQDIYVKNETQYLDNERSKRLAERMVEIDANRAISKSFKKIRKQLYKRQMDIYKNTPLDQSEDGLDWLDEEIKKMQYKSDRVVNYYKTSMKQKIAIGVAYVILIGILGFFYYYSQVILPNPNQLS
ncbi:site-2 protease family protein [Terrilactibacillus laevilacticus]|uniref:Site-2 protease family protein n=1 Tax=Terrilactibacillus laevilacticus TaxID=1380157 RepID=A0ABW5PP81_9BACI|nr:site-2 protease family protein [Terrilactibacillus laevilacticus]